MNEVIRVAYAEDHAILRKSLIYVLQLQGGISINIEATTGEELIDKLQTAAQPPTVCLLDISMPPGMNGFDTIVELRKRWPKLAILVLSQFDLEHYIIRMIQHGASGYLLKNAEPEEIKDAIITVHNGGVYYSDLVRKKWFDAIKQQQIKITDLTEIEKLVLKYSCSDLSYAEIGAQLKLTRRSVEGHRDNLFRKLGVNSRVGLALYAIHFGLVILDEVLPRNRNYMRY